MFVLSKTTWFLNNHLARVPVHPNQQGTHELMDEVLSSVAAQDLDTSGYELSDLIRSCFSDPIFRLLRKYYQSVNNIKIQLAEKWQRPGVKRVFTSLWHVFVPNFVLSFWLLLLLAIRFLMGVMNITFALPFGFYKSLRNSKNSWCDGV